MEIKGKKVIVTGGAQGIGERIVSRLLSEGAIVCAIDISRQALSELAGKYPQVVTIECDISNAAAVEEAVKIFCTKAGDIDILINNAAVVHNEVMISLTKGGLSKHGTEMWDRVIATNLSGVFYASSSVMLSMIRGRIKGLIINVSSIASAGNIGQSAYSAAKAGVNALTVAWAKELGAMGIRVAAVAPGFAKTETTMKSMGEPVINEWVKKTPGRRMAEPDEIVDGIEFIIRNDFFNGRILELDGGLRI